MSSVRHIAKELGISVATVSRAINQREGVSKETRRRVLLAAERAGYEPKIGRKPTNVVGLVYPDEPVKSDLGDFEAALLSGILQGVYESAHDLTFISATRDKHPDESFRQFFGRKGARAVIIRSLGHGALPEAIAAEGFPALLVADRSDDPRVNYIDSYSYDASRQAIEHLVGLGHRRIGLGIHTIRDTDHEDRERGYNDALRDAGIERDDRFIVRAEANAHGGEQMLASLLALETPPTAIFFTNPMSTIGALYTCLRLGIKVPEDLSIVGVDDSNTRFQTYPRYSAVCQDAIELGQRASRWLIRATQSDTVGSMRETLPTRFEALESTGPVPPNPLRVVDGRLVKHEG